MAAMLNLFRRRTPTLERSTPPSIGEGVRVYAIGDIHGRLDLFDRLMAQIEEDEAARPPLPRILILLGDLVDRGAQSAQMVDRAMELARGPGDVRFIKGNHEELLIAAARGHPQSAGFFRRIGGLETLASYGLTFAGELDDDALADWMLNHISRDHIDFLDDFENMLEMEDYLFVHAGIRPRVPLGAQSPADLRWIRGEFLSHRKDHARMVIHGHSITAEVDVQPNRIGIDTGAWRSGHLTAIGLEGTERWFIQT